MMKKRILSLLLCLCMALALLPPSALAVAGESNVDITVTQGAATAKVKSSRMEVESVSWSGSVVTVKVKIKDSQPFTVFAKKASDIYVTVNKEEAKDVQRLDDKHIVVTCDLAAANAGGSYASDPNYVVLQSAHTREELNEKWEECRPMYEGGVYAQTPSVSAPYSTGALVDAAVTDALNYLNYARYSVGLPEVKLDSDLQDRAQYGAVLMAATHQLSHTPSKPANMSQTFYQRGYASTTHSNICSKRVELRVLNDGLLYQLSDATAGNITTVGHRRWLLNPRLGKVGFGAATGSDGIIYHATECHDTSAPAISYEAFAWPVPGYQSIEQFNANDPFSLSLNPDIYDSTRLSEVKATVTVTGADGRKKTYTLDHSDKNTGGEYFNIVKDQIGISGFTVIFRPMFTRVAGTKVTSEVSGLYKKGSSTPVTVRWETEFFYPEYYNFTDMEFEDIVISIERDMEDYATSLGQVADNTVTEADLVRVALYPLRDNRQVAFVGTHDFKKTPADSGFGRITTTIDLTYHDKPFSVKVSAQIMVQDDPGGEKGKALADIKAALKAAGDPGLTSATEVAKSAAAAHGITVTNCNPQHPNTGDNPAYKGLKRYEVTFKTGEKKNEKGYTTSITEKYDVVYDNGKGLGVYLPLGSTEMPAVGALNQKTASIPPSEVAELPSAEPAAPPSAEPEPTPTPVPAAPGDQSGSHSLPKLSQTEMAALIKGASDALSEAPFETQPSGKAPYAAGKVKTAALQAAADRLTMLRRLAGLPAVELDAALNEQAQYGAVLLSASEFSHTPAKPADMDEDFYQKGKSATSSSNLHSYSSSGKALTNALYVLAKAPDALMDDSDSSNVSRVGHRRWQLNPTLQKVGFGFSVEQSGGWINQYVTEKIYDTSGSTSDYDFISWPASGNFPNDLEAFNGNTAWSVTLNPRLYAKPEQSALTVTLTRASDGKAWTFSGGESYAAADSGKYFGVDTTGRGVTNCIIFRPDGVSRYEGTYTVDISGLTTSSGAAATLSYQVEFFNSGKPAGKPAETPAPAVPAVPVTGTAYPSTQTVDLDGKKVEFQMYALKDAAGNPTNYVKVRDLALALNGTKAQFNVGWDGAVNLAAGAAYVSNGSENQTPFSGGRSYSVPTSPTNVNGSASDLTAIFLTDDAGGGYTYYQLRDLGKKLGFNVGWSAERGVFIESGRPYSGN